MREGYHTRSLPGTRERGGELESKRALLVLGLFLYLTEREERGGCYKQLYLRVPQEKGRGRERERKKQKMIV